MNPKYLVIEYANPNDLADTLHVKFLLQNNAFTPLWVNAVIDAKQNYPIDDPTRFYGFGSHEEEQSKALALINNCINDINQESSLNIRRLHSIDDQDTLNYLHHIFEVYHGLLDQQNTEFWQNASDKLRKSLADLNILVHRCESVYRSPFPRHVVTWYGLPKNRRLADEHYNLFTDSFQFGDVRLNYVEIGKTLLDLAIDNDQYICPEAFQPYTHYSADFNVLYRDIHINDIKRHRKLASEYYTKNQEFFGEFKPCYKNGTILLAKLADNITTKDIADRQYVKSVYFV